MKTTNPMFPVAIEQIRHLARDITYMDHPPAGILERLLPGWLALLDANRVETAHRPRAIDRDLLERIVAAWAQYTYGQGLTLWQGIDNEALVALLAWLDEKPGRLEEAVGSTAGWVSRNNTPWRRELGEAIGLPHEHGWDPTVAASAIRRLRPRVVARPRPDGVELTLRAPRSSLGRLLALVQRDNPYWLGTDAVVLSVSKGWNGPSLDAIDWQWLKRDRTTGEKVVATFFLHPQIGEELIDMDSLARYLE